MREFPRRLGGLCVVAVLAALLVGALPLSALVPQVRAQPCPDLIVDGGFETGGTWLLGPSPVMPEYVTYAKHSGNRALLLGITSGANVESYSSARQTVPLPAGAGPLTLSFWAYAMADAPATTDYMEVVLLNATGTAILNKPWQSHNDSRLWNSYSFDLTPWRGQTVQVYFNVYNDGVGGRAAMFLDDVVLANCASPAITGTPTGTVTTTTTPGPTASFTPTWTPTPTGTVPPPGCTNVLLNGGFDAGLTNWQQLGDAGGINVVPNPVHTGPNALQLGSLTQNLTGLSTVRQSVTVPTGYATVTLEVWTYRLSQPGSGADYQEIAVLNASGGPWSQLSYSNPNVAAWQRESYNLAPFSGSTIFIAFSVSNDGSGGRSAMVIDDVQLLACNPGPATSTATPTATRTGTTTPVGATGTPTRTPTPSVTVPPGAGCIQLINNNGFETGVYPWQPGKDNLPARIVTGPDPGGAYAVALGTQDENLYSYSSIRQWVTVPASHPRLIVSFWAYTRAESLWGEDRQQFVVLGPGDVVLTVPWKVLEDERVWRQRPFEVLNVAGQTVGIYFNVINDGKGGRTSMLLDEVYAWACTPDAYPDLASSTPPGMATASMSVTAVELPTPVAGAREAGARTISSAADLGTATVTVTPINTRVELDVPTRMFAGEAMATLMPTPTFTPQPKLGTKIINGVRGWQQRWPWLIPALLIIVVGIIIYIILRRIP